MRTKDLLKNKGLGYKTCYFTFPVLSLVLFVLGWMSVSGGATGVPSPAEVFERLIETFQGPVAKTPMIGHIGISLGRVFSALLIAVATGVPFGIMLGWNSTFRGLFKPIFEILRPIPAIAWVPLVTVWFGVGEIPKILVVYLGVVMPIIVNSYAGVMMVPQINLDVGKTFGASKRALLYDVVLPSSVDAIFAGVRTALSVGWMVLLAAEMISAQSGLGFLITRGSNAGDLALTIVAMLFIGIAGALFSYGFNYLERWMCPWKRK